jgi:Fic family protein
MRHLYGQPVINVKQAAQITGASINTVSSLIVDLVSHGILTEVTGQRRYRLFVFQNYLALFRK